MPKSKAVTLSPQNGMRQRFSQPNHVQRSSFHCYSVSVATIYSWDRIQGWPYWLPATGALAKPCNWCPNHHHHPPSTAAANTRVKGKGGMRIWHPLQTVPKENA